MKIFNTKYSNIMMNNNYNNNNNNIYIYIYVVKKKIILEMNRKEKTLYK